MPEAAREEPPASGASKILKAAAQSIGMFLLIQFAMKQFTSSGQAPKPVATMSGANAPAAPGSSAADFQSQGSVYSAIPQSIAPMWPTNSSLDISMYISPSLVMPSLTSMPSESLVLNEKSFRMGDWSDKREIHTTFPVPREVQNNRTLWAHFYVGQSGSVLDPTAATYDVSKAFHFVRPLTQHLTKKKVAKTRSLLSGKNETEVPDPVPEIKGTTAASYYHPNFTLSLIPDSGVQMYPQVHPAVRQFIQLESTGARDESGQNGWYYPVVYLSTFWQLRTHMTELNETVKRLPLNINLNNLNNWKFNLYASMDEGMKETARKAAAGESSATGDGSELEMFKEILLDSNSYLLATTVFVSILHTIFEMLAFKNDVSHWRNKKDNVGTSVRTILANVFMQSIIFLYLMDNNENTSWMILFGQGIGIAIEAWKITKTVNVRIRHTPAGSMLPYTITFEDKHKLSETEKKTQEYDEIAFKYLYLIAIPLLGAYAVYSLLYDTHKSWYSFVITTLVGSVYAYGFLMMVPSLYINYRLKSVAHLPGKAMTYKFLNTFIDDLFAFTIKMPTLHRLATLRDDVIFFVYLYQSYKYKVDYTRVNEFGQGGADEELEEKIANKPLAAPADADASVQEGKDIKAPEVKVNVKVSKGEARKRK